MRILSRIFLGVLILSLGLLPRIGMAAGADEVTYTIKRGDTLWDISSGKMSDPYLWPKIWEANPSIKNPHLIHPGQKLVIPAELLKKMPELAKDEPQEGAGQENRHRLVVMTENLSNKKISVTPQEYLVSREALLNSGYITEQVVSSGKILSSPKNKIVLGNGDFVYIDPNEPVLAGAKFYVLSTPEKVFHPKDKQFMGYLVRIKGVVETVGEESGKEKAVITESYEEIAPGDLIARYYDVELPAASASEQKPAISGIVLKHIREHTMSGNGGIVYLDKGIADGINIGDTFQVSMGAEPKAPVGTIQVINNRNKTSVAVVRTATEEVLTGDVFKNN